MSEALNSMPHHQRNLDCPWQHMRFLSHGSAVDSSSSALNGLTFAGTRLESTMPLTLAERTSGPYTLLFQTRRARW